ncbi:MAG: redox-regulated ATPase YchF [Enterobacterales bacterium]
MIIKIGIIGLPNVGKSTLFNSLTKSNIKSENFFFSTIKTNFGLAKIKDYRIFEISKIINNKNIIQSNIKFFDIAGLIKGASKGEGLGNKFLNNICECEAIIHLVRYFEDEKIIHFFGKIDPIKDIEIINTELIFYDLEKCEKYLNKIKKKYKNKDKIFLKKKNIIKKCFFHLEKLKMLTTLNISLKEKKEIKNMGFLTLKPMIYIANINENNFKYKNNYKKNFLFYKNKKYNIINVCAKKKFYLSKKIELNSIKLKNNFNISVYDINNLINYILKYLNIKTFFTYTKKEIKSWNVYENTTALKASNKIHSDFYKGFIRARIISYSDFIFYNGENGVKKIGKIHLEGKNYIIKDGDIVKFLFNK